MRLVTYVVMVALVAGAVVVGRMDLALAAAGLKTLLVGIEFMELRGAARPHALVFTLGTVAITGLLVLLT